MKNTLLSLLFSLMFFPLMGQNANSIFLYDTIRTTNGGQLLYRKLTPLKVVEGEKYPLVLFLHGAGQRGSDNEKQLELGGDMFADVANRQNFPAFVLFPQCPSDNYWAFGMRPTQFDNSSFPVNYSIAPIMIKVKELLDSYLSHSNVDLDRVYIIGLSMGAIGAYDMVCRFPEIFAAIVPICGGVNLNRLTTNISNTYWRLFHGALDPIVPVDNSRQIYSHLLSHGAKAQYVEYPDVRHEAWKPAFNSPDFLSWIFEKTRQKNDVATIQPNITITGISTVANLDSTRNNPI